MIGLLLTLVVGIVGACSSSQTKSMPATTAGTDAPSPAASALPAWYDIELVDVRTGESFTMNSFRNKVVLVETMAQWCPTCVTQQAEVEQLRQRLAGGDDGDDLVTVSLDVDLNEDAATLKEYVADHGYDWRFAVAPLEVARALGNLYSAQYLNPPLAPMLVIDRNGTANQLPFGVKRVDQLQELLDPFLA